MPELSYGSVDEAIPGYWYKARAATVPGENITIHKKTKTPKLNPLFISHLMPSIDFADFNAPLANRGTSATTIWMKPTTKSAAVIH